MSETDPGPEFADLRRYGRRLVDTFVSRAREAERPRFSSLIAAHLAVPTDALPVAEQQWPAYEHVNVQAAIDAWLAEPGRTHEVVGVTNYRHRGPFGLSDLMAVRSPMEVMHGPQPGNVSRVALPTGPAGETRQCLRAAVLLVTDGDGRIALLVRGADPDDDRMGVGVEIAADRDDVASQVTSRLRDLAVEHNVYRGQVVSFGRSMFGHHGSVLQFHARHPMDDGALILPADTFADVRRQVVGVARHRDQLRRAGQHLKRGLLLYGPPGVGKTHTVRYLIGALTDTTIVELTGETLPAIRQACSIARTLQPAMIVVEDVDLIAEQRDHYNGETPLLFTLLNEMDGLDDDADVVFLLTTNRADLLEPALAARPGRVDQAVHIDLPDRDARRRLVALYRGSLALDESRLESVLDRTDGVTASFLKELLRRAAVVAAERGGSGAEGGPADPESGVLVSADDLDAALADLLDTRNAMTRRVLGSRPPVEEHGVGEPPGGVVG